MSRILVVARTEFLTIVRTKAFIIGILMVPALVGLSIGFQIMAARQSDLDDHRFAVVDRTGQLYDALLTAAVEHNDEAGQGETRTGPHFLPELVAAEPQTASELTLTLSQRVRDKDLFAFIDIPASILEPAHTDAEQISYYTETPSYSSLPDWIRSTLVREVSARRISRAGLDSTLVQQISRPTNVQTLGLVQRGSDGTITEARRVNQLQTMGVPFIMMYLLFVALMTVAPQLLTAVVEEKMSRISEVLVSAVTPFQLMAGKLLGVAAVAVLLAVAYVSGGLYAMVSTGNAHMINVPLLGWFVLFLLTAVLMFGSVFIAIGAACSDLKDSQSMMQPVMIFMMLPVLAAPVILRSPHATLSVVLSLVPAWTPFLMLVRLAMTPPPPFWQVALSLVLTMTTAVVVVWAAGRILRVGLLMQGKAPNLPELLRWIRQ